MSSQRYDRSKGLPGLLKKQETPDQSIEKIAASKGISSAQLITQVNKKIERERTQIVTPLGVVQPKTLIIIGSAVFLLIVALILYVKLRKKK